MKMNIENAAYLQAPKPRQTRSNATAIKTIPKLAVKSIRPKQAVKEPRSSAPRAITEAEGSRIADVINNGPFGVAARAKAIARSWDAAFAKARTKTAGKPEDAAGWDAAFAKAR